MSQYLFVYRAPTDYGAGTEDAAGAWRAWFQDLGPSLLDLGNPVFARNTLGNCSAESVLGGYSIVEAENLGEALALADGCPHLIQGGGVEIGELTVLDPARISDRTPGSAV